MNNYWLLLLPAAATVGWATAHYKKPFFKGKRGKLPRNYLKGLNFILNEEPDKAVDLFVKMIEVDGETIETHLALGNLFRRRGEVDRAIRIHQNLITRPQLSSEYRNQALYALAKDYMSAGVLDRAERLLLELIDQDPKHTNSHRELLYIYQQEKEWEKAINSAQKLAASSENNMRTEVSQFCCELAEKHKKEAQLPLAVKYAKRAMAVNRQSVRGSLLLGQLEMLQGHYELALKYLENISKQNPDWLVEAVPTLCDAYLALNKSDELINRLKDLLHDYPNMPIIARVANLIRRFKGEEQALQFVADHVQSYPSVTGFHDLLELQLFNKNDEVRNDLKILQALTDRILKDKSGYQCVNCGFVGNTLHWHCPSCKQWETTKPAYLVDDI